MKLVLFSDQPIQRHISLREGKSPFDGDWAYWSARLGQYPDLPKSVAIRMKAQKGICAYCGLHFTSEDAMDLVHLNEDPRDFGRDNVVLLHPRCVPMMKQRYAEMHHIAEEPDDGKLSRPVLKTSVSGDTHA
jgi:RNA-directed DNA polymerase